VSSSKKVLAIARHEDPKITSERSVTWALEWLADRLWGRPVASIELTAPDARGAVEARFFEALNGADLSDDDLRTILRADEIVAKARAAAIKAMPLAQLESVAIAEAVAAGQTEEQAREDLRRQQRELRSMLLAELKRAAAGETDETTTATDGDTDDAA